MNPLNNYNYIASAPPCTTTNFAACYNPDADYGTSLLDVPHRVIIAPMFELPFGRGKKWGSNSTATELILGGWTIVAAINVQSGFPLSVQQTDNTGLLGGVQRPNLVPGATLGTPGSYRGSVCLGRPSDRDLAQPGGLHRGARVHLRQRATDDYRRAIAGSVQR